MDSVFDFLNQPVVLTILSLTIGGYLFNLISDRRERKNKIRDKAIEFINEISLDINSVTARLYGRLVSRDLEIHDELREAMTALLRKRFSVQIRSVAYLNSNEFWQKYDQIAFELRKVVVLIASFSKEHEMDSIIAQVQATKKQLSESWPLEEEIESKDPDPLIAELSEWLDMIRDRAVKWLSVSLKAALK